MFLSLSLTNTDQLPLLSLLSLESLETAQEEHADFRCLEHLKFFARLMATAFLNPPNFEAFFRSVLGFRQNIVCYIDELMRRQASPLFVQGIAQAIAIHLARNYALTAEESHSGSPSLPGYNFGQITDWMAEHVAEDLNLDRLAAQAGLSKFHFHRLFKGAMGISPARYHIYLRMTVARRLLRETKKSVVAVALDVGYANPSHFAKLFRRETGLSPSDYRRQR